MNNNNLEVIEKKSYNKHLKNNYLPEYSFPKRQRVGEG